MNLDYFAASINMDKGDLNAIKANLCLFDKFCSEAIKIAQTGRKRYSARTIIEYMRHHTNLQGADRTFKINGNLVPKFSRLAMACYPELNGFFETRGKL